LVLYSISHTGTTNATARPPMSTKTTRFTVPPVSTITRTRMSVRHSVLFSLQVKVKMSCSFSVAADLGSWHSEYCRQLASSLHGLVWFTAVFGVSQHPQLWMRLTAWQWSGQQTLPLNSHPTDNITTQSSADLVWWF